MNHFPMNFRRQRKNKALRDLFAQVVLSPKNLIQPYFVYEELSAPRPLPSLVGQQMHTLESLSIEIEKGLNSGINSVLLFIVPSEKREKDFHYTFDTHVIGKLKAQFGDSIVLMTDLCLCSNTLSGHCGILQENGEIENNKSVQELSHKALSYALAGADIISPSDMMDDRILAIRQKLDQNSLHSTLIMSYSTKFQSHFYGPFRQAAGSSPTSGDRSSYQIDFRSPADALRCSLRDADQGADILMVKPAGAYLDIIYQIKHHPQLTHFPLAAYQVSGEFQSLHLMDQAGLLSFPSAYWESLVALKRAGADMIITYGANTFAQLD